jgi:bifunctional diaminopimelate decarboxylase / aspartate kinase
MRTHGGDPFAAEAFLFPDVYEAARDLLKKDNPAVVIGYAERGEDTVKVIAEAIRPADKWENERKKGFTMTVANKWWFDRREELETLAREKSPVRIYIDEILNEVLFDLLYIDAIERVFYKAGTNPHPRILEKVNRMGAGFKCISRQEITHLSKIFPDITPGQFLFAPVFAGPDDYEYVFEKGITVVLNDVYPIKAWPNIFEGKAVFLQVSWPEQDAAGSGIPVSKIEYAAKTLNDVGAKVKGLHVESEEIDLFEPGRLMKTASFIAGLASSSPQLSVLSLGNEIGLSERQATGALDIKGIRQELEAVTDEYPQFKLWLEPGAGIFSDAGVILTKVTQASERKGHTYVRMDMEMKIILQQEIYAKRPDILNLSKLDEDITVLTHVIGKEDKIDDSICYVTRLAPIDKGDILLITNTGISSIPLVEPIKEHYLNARKMCPVNI